MVRVKIEYRYTKDDKKFLNELKSKDSEKIFSILSRTNQSSYEIQKIWQKIHACKEELIKLYCKQTNIKNKSDCQWGICINDRSYIPEKLFDCSVGMVRKMRNNIENSDGTCKTCPYFISEEDIDNWYRSQKMK